MRAPVPERGPAAFVFARCARGGAAESPRTPSLKEDPMHQPTDAIVRVLQTDINLRLAEPEALVLLARRARQLQFAKGEYVFHAGEAATHFYLMQRGKVIMSKEAPSGRSFTYLVAGPGMSLSGIACFKDGPRLFTARVVEDATVLSIPSAEFRAWVQDNPAVAIGILGTMGDMLNGAYTRVLDLIDESVETRVVNVLRMLHARLGTDLPLTNSDIAEMTGTSRESAARVVSRLQAAGILSKSRGRITICDPECLSAPSGPFFII